MNMIWLLPAESEVPWLSTADIRLPNTTNTWLFLQLKKKKKRKKKAWRMDLEGRWTKFLPPGLKYCSDMLFCGLLGNEGNGLRWGGLWGHWPKQWPYHTSPLSFTVILKRKKKKKINTRTSRARLRSESHLTRHWLGSQEVGKIINWRTGKKTKGRLNLTGWHLLIVAPCATCTTLFLQSLSEVRLLW